MTHVALLRGINVGGRGTLPMRELAAIFAEAGGVNVRTYLQSGNVLFDAAAPELVVETVTARIAAVYGYPGRIVLRSAEQFRAAFAANPYLKTGVAAETLHVYFLSDAPPPWMIRALDPDRSPGDSFVVRGREIYLHLPQGMARTKLTNVYFDKTLKTVSTARNWNTISRLAEML